MNEQFRHTFKSFTLGLWCEDNGTPSSTRLLMFSLAAVVGTSQGSPVVSTCGRAFHGSADVEDCMTISELPGNGNDAAIAFNIGHTGTSTGTVTTISSNGITESAFSNEAQDNIPGAANSIGGAKISGATIP